MAKHRDRLPDDLKELVALCRAGRLFTLQDRLVAGQRFRPPPGNYLPDLLDVVVDTGFHSLVELFLRQELTQDERDQILVRALWNRRQDLVELAAEHGAVTRAKHEVLVYSSLRAAETQAAIVDIRRRLKAPPPPGRARPGRPRVG